MEMNSTIKISYKKTKKGRFNKVVSEIYFRDDIPCGIKTCPVCENNIGSISLDTEKEKFVYILDTNTIINQIDLIENCPILNNVVILQTILEEVKSRNQKVFESLRNLIEMETHRKFHLFTNEYFKHTYVEKSPEETNSQRIDKAIMKATKWYTLHCKAMKIEVLFITNSFKAFEEASKNKIKALTIYDFIKNYCGDYPDLIDYLGFDYESEDHNQMDIEDDNSKNAIYDKYLDENEIIGKLKTGQLFQGKVFISRNNIEEGTVLVPKYGIEIKLLGSKNLNRAINGDVVAIKLLPENEWLTIKLPDLEDEDTTESIKIDAQETIKSNDDNDDLKSLIERIKRNDLTPCGKIIGILKRNPRNYCGQLKPKEKNDTNMMVEKGNNSEVREFLAADARIPTIYVRLRNGDALNDKKIMIAIDSWPIYSKYPYGHFIKALGNIGDEYTEGNVILLEHNVEIRNFSKQVLDCLPPEGEKWRIPESEIKARMDLRNLNICSIDPPGCKDIDDALHCVRLPNGNYQVGVHIADVSYYVKPDAAIDLEAAHRCTTVYLVGRRTDMLPKLLTETLCSLVSNVDRLAFSVIWEMTPDAKIVKTEYTKSIINSKASLTYEQAQKRLEDKNDNTVLTQSIRDLNMLAKIIRKRRVDSGALTLASTQVKFSFSEETHNPTDVSFYSMYETNYLVEEYMLLANIAVAEKILYHFPSNSVLRRHPPPKLKQIKEFGKLIESLGYKYDYSTSKNLADSLDHVAKPKDPFFNKVVRILTTRCMNEANYFNTADADYPEFFHYGLACQVYTHFTSPIRRYADVLVHRLLAAAIDIESLPKSMCNKQRLTKITDKMNMRHRNARNASRASSDYYTYIFFRNRNVVDDAVICSIQSNGIGVIMPVYGLEGFINFDIEDEKTNIARFKEHFGAGNNQTPVNEVIIKGNVHKMFDHITVKITVELEHFHKKIFVEYIGRGKI